MFGSEIDLIAVFENQDSFYLEIDTDIAAQLRFQLRATRIAGRQFANCIPIGGDIPELMTAHLDWSAGWNLGDELIEDED